MADVPGLTHGDRTDEYAYLLLSRLGNEVVSATICFWQQSATDQAVSSPFSVQIHHEPPNAASAIWS